VEAGTKNLHWEFVQSLIRITLFMWVQSDDDNETKQADE
jgi:hypothetical protein